MAAQAQRLLDLLNALGSTTFRQLLWQRASELDLTFAQSQVLFYVADHPACPMGEVAKAFGVTLPAITHIVDRLEEKRFILRADHPGDRRVYVLELTRAGQSLVEELHGIQMRALDGVLTRMSADDRERAVRGIEALVEAAVEASAR
jgi:DNA-binding MarR family transcriptional regulator